MREEQAAKYLGVTTRTLRNYRHKGVLSYREVSGKTRPTIEYDQADLDSVRKTLEARRANSKKPRKPRIMAPKRISFDLSPEDHTELAEEAHRYGISVSEHSRRLLRERLESRFQSEAAELRNELKRLKSELERAREDFAGGFEALLEFNGLSPAEARSWVNSNLR